MQVKEEKDKYFSGDSKYGQHRKYETQSQAEFSRVDSSLYPE